MWHGNINDYNVLCSKEISSRAIDNDNDDGDDDDGYPAYSHQVGICHYDEIVRPKKNIFGF